MHLSLRSLSFNGYRSGGSKARSVTLTSGFEFLPALSSFSLPVWKSTSASGAPDNSSPSHFSAMTWPLWLGRAARNRHRHAIEQASRRWRGGRRDDSARTRRKILISTQQFATNDVYDNSKPEPELAGFADRRVVPRDGLAEFERRRLVSRMDVALLPLGLVRFETCADIKSQTPYAIDTLISTQFEHEQPLAASRPRRSASPTFWRQTWPSPPSPSRSRSFPISRDDLRREHLCQICPFRRPRPPVSFAARAAAHAALMPAAGSCPADASPAPDSLTSM